MPESIDLQIQTLPHVAGVYQFYDALGRLLYVGKAKDLKKRVSSYFQKQHNSAKLEVMVKKIVEIKHIVVNSENDALLLENSLIKKHQPRYNVMLKDDKSFPWICIKNEPFPRLFYTRRVVKDGSEYFGPYPSVKTIRVLFDLIKNLYPLRSCNYDLTLQNIDKGRFKVCLDYHIKNCKGPCEKLQAEDDYNSQIEAIRHIIKGNFNDSLAQFRKQMQQLALELRFEEAQLVKEKIASLESYQAKSIVVSQSTGNLEVFSIVSDESHAYVNYVAVAMGSVVRSHSLEIKKKLDETDEELLTLSIVDIRQNFVSEAKEIVVPFWVEVGTDVKVTVPKSGDKKYLLDFSTRNAKFYRQDKIKQVKITDPDRHVNRIMTQMRADLRLSEEPRYIECFDNSNLQGTNPVAACVVFKNGKPSKADYRHFNIKSVEGPNDFASMEEIVYRRYKRLLEEAKPLPNLIVVDGGKGQLSSAVKSLDALGLRRKIAIIGIAKRLEEIFYPEDPVPLYLDKTSETLKIIQQLRNEAHRFGITFHRAKRSKEAFRSELDQIEGIGEKTKEVLLRELKSVKRIKEANIETLTELVGKDKALKILNNFS